MISATRETISSSRKARPFSGEPYSTFSAFFGGEVCHVHDFSEIQERELCKMVGYQLESTPNHNLLYMKNGWKMKGGITVLPSI